MGELGRGERVDELVRVYRAHNEPLHDELEALRAGWTTCSCALKDEGRRLGIVTAKRRSTVELAFARVPIGHLFDVVVGGDETGARSPRPIRCCSRSSGSARRPARTPPTSATRRSTWRRRRRAASTRSASPGGGIHDRDALGDADVIVDTAEELLAVL